MVTEILGNINEENIKKFFTFLRHIKQTELRCIRPRWYEGEKRSVTIFTKDIHEAILNIKLLNGQYNIYVGINERKENCKADEDVEFITNIGHDIDAHNSGDEGLIRAGGIAVAMREDSIKLGYKEPMIINSGRGYWVIHHVVPILNTEENVKKIKEFGRRISEKYKAEGIEIDSTVYNPSRIARVPGTLNVGEKDKFVMSSLINDPELTEDIKLKEDILAIEIKTYNPSYLISKTLTPSINSFMDYCLTHEIPKGERHKVISRHVALYISDHPDREILKQQYCKIQKGNDSELDNWLRNIDRDGKDKYPFSIGQLVKFTQKYKIPFDWSVTKEYQLWKQEQRAEKKMQVEIAQENKAEELGKAVKFFTDKRHLAQQMLKIQPIYYDNAKVWWIWNFDLKCWEIIDEVDIMNCINKHSEANTISSTDKNEILEALRQESRKVKPKQVKPTWIQFKNIIYDLEDGERYESTPEYFATNPIPHSIGDKEDTPNMDLIFEQWVGKDHVKTLYEILAYCLLMDYPIHRIFCFVGGGMNGKSKFLELLRKFVGLNNCSTTELDTLLVSRFEVTRLHRKLVCQLGETNFNEMSKTSLLKKLCGGDLIHFEYKGKSLFEDKNYAKILISTNNLPATTDKTIGFYRRWMIIDFFNTFDEKKDILVDIPIEEYNNLCLKCVYILETLLDKREFTNEGTIEQRMERYESKSNFIDKFIKTYTSSEDINSYITTADFYKKFVAWSKENRLREMSETSVSMAMKKLGYEQDRKYFDWMFDGKGGQTRCWMGIKWK